ncbi:uroporphyrinogen III methyltransferase [Sulfitobacter pacificus]|uniref:Uroporphyrinogen III methyltransferase n=2 Tax=Sulfitobacter pacificus TaxID=1499314 RepID=A0ABQ5VMJ7_9RHOB|nr:uroporphyrinogen III methyltransferase [Sulfitobacter pacificus]
MLGPQMYKRALLLTRPDDSAARFVARLSDCAMQSVTTCFSPLLEIVSTGETADLTQVDAVIFTSARAVEFVPAVSQIAAFCVGVQTAEAARSNGWDVKLVAQTADALVASMRAAKVKGRLLHLAGVHRRGQIAARLGETGSLVEVVPLYEQRLLPLSDAAKDLLSGEIAVVVPLFSPRTAAQFVDQAPELGRVVVAAISPAVAQVFESGSVKAMHIAEAPTGDDMARLVEMLLCHDRLP